MRKLNSTEQKLFDFISGHEHVTLDEIKRWGELDFIRGYTVNEFCRNLVREGMIKATLLADGVTLYSVVETGPATSLRINS